MTVTEYADILRNPELTFYEDGSYTSHTTQKEGYRATFQLAQKWFWYSVFDTHRKSVSYRSCGCDHERRGRA